MKKDELSTLMSELHNDIDELKEMQSRLREKNDDMKKTDSTEALDISSKVKAMDEGQLKALKYRIKELAHNWKKVVVKIDK